MNDNLSKNIKFLLLLFSLSFLSQLPLSLIRFYVPIYAIKIGATGLILGLMGFSYGAVYIFTAYTLGKKSEKIGYIRSLGIGLFSYAIVVLLYALIKLSPIFILLRAFEALAMGFVWPSLEALTKFFDNRKTSTAIYTIGWSIASSVAPFLGSSFAYVFTLPFLIASAISFIGGFLSLGFKPIKYEEEKISSKINLGKDIVFPIFIYGFSVSIIYAFYSAFATTEFGIIGSGIIMSVSSIFIILAFITAPFFKGDPKFEITFGIGLQVLYIVLFISRNFLLQMLSLSLIFYGTGILYFYVLYKIMLTESKGLGLRTGLFESSIGAGYTIGPLIGGIVSFFGLKYVWLVTFISAIAFLIFWLTINHHL
ncbi:MAG: MFS transporter [Nitrososphaeria archaeon]